MSPETYMGLLAVVPLVGLLALVVVRAARDDVRISGSRSRAFWHPGVLFLVALVALIAACVWVAYSFSLGSAILFLASATVAAGAGLSLELRRRRPGVGVVAFLGLGVGWFLGGGFIYLVIAIGAHG